MTKLTISLSVTDVKILASVLGHILTGTDVKTLKEKKHTDYLLFACVYDFFNKLDTKNKEMASFGAPVGKVSFQLKRHEAIAFFFLCNSDDEEADSYLPAVPDYTANLINSIVAQIHRQFLV